MIITDLKYIYIFILHRKTESYYFQKNKKCLIEQY